MIQTSRIIPASRDGQLYSQHALSIIKEKLSFPNQHGEQLAALLERPQQQPVAYVLFAHCFTCSKNIVTATRVSRELANRGFAVLRFDFTGIGNSEGEFSDTNLSSNIQDLIAASEYMTDHFQPPAVLIGHSLGGAAAISAARHLPDTKAVVTIAAPGDPAHMHHLLRDSIDEIKNKGWAHVKIGDQQFKIKKQFLDDVSEQNLEGVLKIMDKPLLIMHSPKDQMIEIEHAYHLFEIARCPKSFISLGQADHLLSKSKDAEYAAEIIAAWVSHYL